MNWKDFIIIGWYVIGFISYISYVKHYEGKLSYGDIATGLTGGGILGLITLCIVLDWSGFEKWWIKKKILILLFQ